jgi:hypothetical protein
VLRQDYIGRLIQQLAEALARVAKLVRESKADDAEAELRVAEDALGLPRGIDLFDARSAALVIGGGDKVVLAALLLEHHALIFEARDKQAEAGRARARARALLEHARPHELRDEAAALSARLAGDTT